MSRKMTKDIKLTVESANELFRTEYMQENRDARETLSSFMCKILMKKNMYHGFNYFIEKDGMLRLAGKETTLIQFYVM